MRVWSLCLRSIAAEAATHAPERPSSSEQVAVSERSGEQFIGRAYIAADVREQITAILVQIILGQSQEVPR